MCTAALAVRDVADLAAGLDLVQDVVNTVAAARHTRGTEDSLIDPLQNKDALPRGRRFTAFNGTYSYRKEVIGVTREAWRAG